MQGLGERGMLVVVILPLRLLHSVGASDSERVHLQWTSG